MISIIIPIFNRGHILKETVSSIQKQSFDQWELLIIDDHSTDDTVDIVKSMIYSDSRIQYFLRPYYLPRGANSCRNYGYIKSKGSFIKWIDSDDILRFDCLYLQNNILVNNSEVCLCLGYSQFFNFETNQLEHLWSRSNQSENIFSNHIVNKIGFGIGGLLWRKSCLTSQPFHPSLKNSQEWLLHSTALLRLKEYQIFNCIEIIYFVRRGHLRMSSSKSFDYYLNQAKARLLLIRYMIFHKRFIINDYFQLSKQVLVYYFYAFISFFKFRFIF